MSRLQRIFARRLRPSSCLRSLLSHFSGTARLVLLLRRMVVDVVWAQSLLNHALVKQLQVSVTSPNSTRSRRETERRNATSCRDDSDEALDVDSSYTFSTLFSDAGLVEHDRVKELVGMSLLLFRQDLIRFGIEIFRALNLHHIGRRRVS